MIRDSIRIALIALIASVGSGPARAESAQTQLSGSIEQGPKSASVTILVFSDFECPFCARLVPVLKQIVEKNAQDVRVVFKSFPLDIHQKAMWAHEAALAAAASGRFWAMHDALFADQTHLGRKELVERGRRLGLPEGAIERAIDQSAFRDRIERDLQDGRDLGVMATPTLFVNGRKFVGAQRVEVIQAAIDEQLGRHTETDEAPLAPTDFDLSHSSTRGSPGAPITIVEFSDLRCPFCARMPVVLEEVLKRYAGQVRWVFKHFPLPMHSDAPLAHAAAQAAGEQGRFWEMHDAIFARSQTLQRSDVMTLASQLGLNVDRFVADLDRQSLKALVDRDVAEGRRAGVTGTPTFFINGTRLSGAVPATEFFRSIDAELARLAAPAPAR
jgi:protein-disulfide isomerase